jgi:hypothetical protein
MISGGKREQSTPKYSIVTRLGYPASFSKNGECKMEAGHRRHDISDKD